MAYIIQVLILSILGICQGQNYLYSSYSNPYQNSFAFATPNLKQIFTTKLSSPLTSQPINQGINQQLIHNLFRKNVPLNQPQYQEPLTSNNNYYSSQVQSNEAYALYEQQLRQQMAYSQYQQQQQRDSQLLQQFQPQQFQAPFTPSEKDSSAVESLQQQQKVSTQHLLGVAYSPSTKVSQVKFDSEKLKYDF